MTKRELEMFRKKLLLHKEEFENQLKYYEENNLRQNLKDSSGDLSSFSTHPADKVQDELDHEKAYLFASKLRDTIYAIDEALERIEKDEYGICVACEKPIDKKRLKAISWAEYCIDCKKKFEEEEQETGE